jgi:predicted transcriptional regulator
MNIERIKEILNAEVILGDNLLSEIKMGCGCDLMSDVLSFIKSDTLLLTGLTNRQVIYTAEIAEIKVICFVRGKKPEEEVIELAREKNIVLLRTDLPMFESCGRLYKAGLIGCSEGE